MTIVVIHFLIGSFLLVEVASQPLKNDISQEQLSSHLESTAVAIFFFISVVITISYCVCCSAKNVKDLGQQNGISASHHSSNNFPSNVNSSEFTIFPPSSSIIAQPINYSDDKVTFEPLPEILPQKSHDHHPGDQLLLAKFNNSIHKGLSDWFNESLCDYFPRNKLQYHQELGSCWFGQVVLGEAKGIIDKEQATKVVVKILKQDATPNEYVNFLQEIRPFRDLSHPNVIKLLGYCLETNPYLFIMEHCAIDLKAYLISHCDEAEFLLQNGHILHMTCDIAAGLQHMHDHDFVHMDLAARNCFITADNIVKLGGYGTSLQIYKDEYYCQGNAALPLRWCDPDSITCVMNLIETREVTKAANVWSFGVILWEVLEFGKLPYFEHTDEEVLQKVILERSCLLKAPSTPCVHNDRIYEIMQMCWNPVDTRCSIHRIAALINHLYDNKDLISNSTAFETRWASLQPHSIEQNLFAPTESSIPRVVLKLENDFAQNSQMILQLDHSYISTGNTSPSHDSISNSTGIEFASVSPSMQNLRGSLEDLNPFGLSTDSISSEHIPSNNTFFCNVEHAKSNEMASKDIVSHSLSTPVSVNDIVLCHEQNIVMNDCKTGSSDITSVVVDNQCKGVLDKLEMSEQTENLSFVSERDNITFNEKCKNNEVMQGSQPALRTTEVDKRDTKSCFDNSCDKCTFKALRSNEGYKCMCSFDKSVKAPSNFINISQAASSDKSLFLEPDTTEIKNYIESTRRNFKPTNTYTSSSMQLLPTNSENVGFVNSKSCTSSSEDEKFITEQFKDKELMCANSMTYKCCETDCSDKVNNEKSEVTLDTALLNDLSTSCDGCTSSPRATKPSDNNTMINNDGTFFSNHNKFSNDEFIKSCSVHRESFNPEIENTAIDHLNASYSESPSHDNIVIYNQITDYFPMPTKKNISYPNKQVCPSNTNLEREIEPGGNKDKIFATVLSKNISSPSENFMTNTVRQQIYNPKLQILTNITKTDLENNADVESTNATPPLTITNCGKESLEMSDLNTKLTHYDIEKSCHNSILSNIKQSNEEQSGLSVEHQHDSQVDHTTDERSGLYDVSMCQSTQPIIQVTECSASPGSQSEGDEYQLEDISSVLKEVEQINIHDCATVSSAVEHNSVLLNDDRKLSGSHYSSDQAGPSEWKSDHTLATCSNYWTERIPLSSNSCSTIEEENNKMKSLSDVILEDLDADCEKDVVACYEPYQDPFETDEVLSIDTETNVAVLLDSHHSVIGFVPSKVDIFTGSREVEDEVLSNSEMQSNLSDFVDNNTQIYINGYKSSDSVSPRSLCSTSTDFSINADQQSETSVDSDLVPDLSASCSINECKASFENNSKSLLQQDLETKSEQQYASDTNLDFSVSNKVVKDMDLGTNVDFDMNCRQANSAMLNSSFLHHAGDIVSPNRDTYTPDFDSDTDDTSSTGTTCTSTSGSFECLYKSSRVIPSESMDVSDDENQSKSPVQIFSVTWDRNATPTKSSIKSPEKKGGQMKKSVSFQDEDPPLFSYPPESEGSDDDSRGFDYPANFLWNVDYSVYADWDFQSSLDLEEIPEDIVEVEDPEDDDEYLSFRYKSLPLRPIQVYTFTDITDDDYSESASLNTSLSDVGIGEQSADSQGMYLEAKSINDAPSPSSSVPKEVCQEVLEMYPNFDDLAMLDAVQNESDENSYHRSDNFTVVDVQDFDQVMDHSNFKKCYLNFAKHDTTLSSEHCEVSEEALAESENPRFFNDSLQKLHCGEPDKLEPSCLINAKKPRQATNKDEEDNGLVNNVCEVDSENIPEFFHEVKNLDEMCENSSYGNSVNFYQEDCYFKEINDSTTGVKYSSDVENKNNIEHSKSAVNAHLSHTDAKEKNNDKYAYTVDAEFLGAQSNKAECQSQDILDMQISELKNTSGTDQYSDSFSPADVSVNIDNTFQNYDKSKFLNAVNTEELGFDNCDLINKAVIPSEYENSTGNIIRPNTLPLCTTDLKFPFQKNHESNFDEPQTTLSSTYIADDHSCDMLYLSKGSEKFPFVDKLDNSNIANDDNTNTSYYSSNLDEIDIAATNAGLQDGRNILYEDVAEGKDTSECSLSSKSTEDSSEKDSAISSGGEFSPAYSPGILQESRDTIWDFQHMSCVDDSEKSTLMENAKDDNENSNAGPVVNTDTSELLPAIVVSDSNNVNFTIHNASVMQTCNNFRYEHNGNIPTDTRGNVATSGCDKNDNIV